MEHFDICNSIYYILIVFYVDVFVHIYQQVDQQKQYLEKLKEDDKKKQEEQEKNKKQTIIDQLEIMLENIKKRKNNEEQEEEEEKQEQEEQIRDDKPPDFLRDTDPIFLSTNIKSTILLKTLLLIIIYVLLLLNVIPTYFTFYFSLIAIFNAIVNIFLNVIYIIYLKYNHSLADDMKDKSFYTVFTMVVFYITQFSLAVLTILLAIRDIYSTPIQLPYLCLLLYSLFFILYAYLCCSMYVQYLNLKKQVNNDASTFKNIHQCLTYCMILNLLIYGTTLLVSVFNFVDYIKIFAIVSIISGSLTLLFTLIYSYFIKDKIANLDYLQLMKIKIVQSSEVLFLHVYTLVLWD